MFSEELKPYAPKENFELYWKKAMLTRNTNRYKQKSIKKKSNEDNNIIINDNVI